MDRLTEEERKRIIDEFDEADLIPLFNLTVDEIIDAFEDRAIEAVKRVSGTTTYSRGYDDRQEERERVGRTVLGSDE